MDKQSKSRRKLSGRVKQSSLVQSFSKSQQKGKQRVHASAASVAGGLRSTRSTEPVVIVLEDDPYTFTDSQSHKLESHVVPKVDEHTMTPRRVNPRPPQTPSRKSTPKPKKSPAVKMEEELERREEEELQKALEESRKELEKEKRRRRHERRETQVEVEEQCKLPSELQKHEKQLTKETGASNQTITRHESGTSEDVLLEPVLQQVESETKEATSSQPTSSDSIVRGARNSPSLKAVTVKKLNVYSLQSFKKDNVCSKLDSLEEENEEAVDPTEGLSVSTEDEDDKFSLQNETTELEETNTISESYQGDETPPLSKTSTQGNEQQSTAHTSLKTTPSGRNDETCSDDFSEPIGDRDSTDMEAESEPCITKHSERGIGVEFEEADVSSGEATKMDVEAEGGCTPVEEEEEKHSQQPEQTSELGKPMELKALTGGPTAVPLDENGGIAEAGSLLTNKEQKTPAIEGVQEADTPSTDNMKNRSSHLSLKRARANSKLSLFRLTKEPQSPQAKKLRLEDSTSEKQPQAIVRNQSEQDPSGDLNSKMSATVCPAEKRETTSPCTSKPSLLASVGTNQLRAQTAPVLASHKRGTLNRGSSKPLLPLSAPVPLTTASIVQYFDDYNAQLLHAQRQVIHRVKWGKPVVSHNMQSSKTLDFKPKRRSTRVSRAKHASTGYSIDLSSLPASKVESPVLPTASKMTTPSDSKSSPQQISSTVIQEGQLDEPLKTTPSRQRLSLGRKALNQSKPSHQGTVSNVPSVKKQPPRTSVNAGITIVSGEPRIYDFSDTDDDVTPPRSQAEEETRSAGHVCAHTSLSPYRSPPRMDDKPTSQTSQTSPFRSKLVPKNRTEQSHANEGVSTNTANHLEDSLWSKMPVISPPPSEEEWISTRAGRKSGGPVTSRAVKPMLRITTTRSRKRARILNDSSDSDGAGNSPDAGSTNHGRKQPLLNRPASVNPDAHSPEIGSTEYNPGKDGDDVSAASSGHSSDSSLPPSFLLYAGSSRRKRHKRGGKPMETPKDKPAESVIDLTEDSQLEQDPIPNPPSPLQQVPCPLCLKTFDHSLIEQHAALCDGISGNEGESTTGLSSFHQDKSAGLGTLRPSSSKPPPQIQEEGDDEEWSSADQESEQEDNERFSESDDGQTTEDRKSQTEPKVYRSEDGGFYIDPSTISKSPIRTFTRIGDLDPKESDMYYNQFSRKSKRKSRAGQTPSQPFAVGSNWERPKFDDLLPGGGSDHERHYDSSRSYHSKWRRGRGGAGWRGAGGRGGKGRAGGRGGRGGAGGRGGRGGAGGRGGRGGAGGRGERRGKQQKGKGWKT